eukprot:3941409-Prymnesium_polylepis.3
MDSVDAVEEPTIDRQSSSSSMSLTVSLHSAGTSSTLRCSESPVSLASRRSKVPTSSLREVKPETVTVRSLVQPLFFASALMCSVLPSPACVLETTTTFRKPPSLPSTARICSSLSGRTDFTNAARSADTRCSSEASQRSASRTFLGWIV